MSATNWAECPQCKILKGRFDAEIQRRVKEFYGKIDVDSFDRLRANVKKIVNPYDNYEECLREDYEMYVTDEGDLKFRYSCYCENCGFRLEHRGGKEGSGVLPEGTQAEDAAYEAFEELGPLELTPQ